MPSTSEDVDSKKKMNRDYPKNDRYERLSFSNSSSSTSPSDPASRHESHESVPSLYKAVRNSSYSSYEQTESKLAFTTEDLLRTPITTSSKSSSLIPLSLSRRKFRHGYMSPANDSNMAATTAYPNSVARRTQSLPIDSTIRARPTVTTILRQQHVLERAEKKEKEKLDSLMVSNSLLFQSDNVSKQKEKKEAAELKAAETKRLLEAKLAYERAKAASRKIADEKQKLAEGTRQQEKEWQSMLTEQRQAELQLKKSKTGNLQRSTVDCNRAFEDMRRLKQDKANKMKMEMERLQLEARQKQKEEEMKRQDKIQQIQAAKLALKKTKETMGSPNQFLRSIAIPETQIKLRLQKEEEKRKLEETRKKIQAEKQVKSVKLIRAMKKIQSFGNTSKKQFPVAEDKFLFSSMSNIRHDGVGSSTTGKKIGELDKMLLELKMLKQENFVQRQAEEQLWKGRVTGSNVTLKVIGASNISNNISSSSSNTLQSMNVCAFTSKKRPDPLTIVKHF